MLSREGTIIGGKCNYRLSQSERESEWSTKLIDISKQCQKYGKSQRNISTSGLGLFCGRSSEDLRYINKEYIKLAQQKRVLYRERFIQQIAFEFLILIGEKVLINFLSQQL